MRLDRMISLYLARPLLGRGTARSVLPILMYHSISDDTEPGVSPYFRVVTSPQRFRDHLDSLAERGWNGVSLEEGIASLKLGNAKGPHKQVAITFDDGFRDFYLEAWPALRKHGFTATMFLATNFISWKQQFFKNRPCMTWSEVRECRQAGIRFGSHTLAHPFLPSLSWADIRKELVESKQVLERELSESVVSFAHPYAFPLERPGYSERFKLLLAQSGYKLSVTTLLGRANAMSDMLCLPRLPVNQEDDRALLMGKVMGHYDWMGLPQRFLKHLKGWLSMASLVPNSK